MTIRTALPFLFMLLALPLAQAQSLPELAPIPFARPDNISPKPGNPGSAIDALTAAGVSRPEVARSGVAPSARVRTMTQGLDALTRGDIRAARRARNRLEKASLERRVLNWALAQSNNRSLSSTDISAVADSLANWPGALKLRAQAERALFRENRRPQLVISLLGSKRPQTFHGVVALGRAYLSLGQKEKARALVSSYWRKANLDASSENTFLKTFGKLLSKADHRFRMEQMMYRKRIRSAERVAGRADGKELVKAWAAVIRGHKNALRLLNAVPMSKRTAGYIFAKTRYLRRADRFDEAAALILTAPLDAESLVDPDEWWVERRVLSRELLDIDDPERAYQVAVAHSAESPARAADAEFHAGWYALRFLYDAPTAARHFSRIERIASGPISRARANYWMGRAAEAGGPGEATEFYEKAAHYGATFYGQLATAALDREELTAHKPAATDRDRRHFSARTLVRAIKLLEQTNHAWRADGFYRELAQTLTNPGELSLLVDMAKARKDYMTALRIGKIAASRGLDIGALAHPLGAIPAAAALPAPREALAYAVARQETEFNTSAVSPAGARGLLQLMPATAREMARRSGLPYSRTRLKADPIYNIRLGAAYLDQQLGRFNGSYILTFAGYNAGPSRAVDWMKRYGDPRGKPVEEIVDWVERIPYTETRNYVQRVMENLQVYKMRLTGKFDMARDIAAGG
ncbi:lytic transglycosylase domain-containing protein [Nitratireductor sp. GISD-1A_MAKvit]|uniref:lytic transglycosylase domain-containing protein n=1 Tax=Nitratireductor sp. GISD-1A_MAKvit TaxID=3234198 RepID=UPI0034651A94